MKFHLIVTNLSVTIASALLFASAVHADPRTALTLIANIQPSATIEITDGNDPITTLNFKGSPGTVLNSDQGSVMIRAYVSTIPGNSDTIIQVKCSDLVGHTVGDAIPATDVSYTHSTDTGGGSWYAGDLSNDWSTLAKLTPGSGVYTGDQTFYLKVPPATNYDTYVGTVSYQVVAF